MRKFWSRMITFSFQLVLTSVAIVFASPRASAEADKLGAKAIQLRDEQAVALLSEDTVVEHTRSLVELYDTFMSIENHPNASEKINRIISETPGAADRREWVIPGIRVTKDTTLGDALVELEQKSHGAYRYRKISDQICLIPAESGVVLPSPLDKIISYSCEDLSTKAAIGGLIAAFNSQYPHDEIVVQTNAEMYFERMPSHYYSTGTIDLDVRNVSMRKVICELMNSAPVRLYYNFHTKDEQKGLPTHLLIICTNYKMPEKMVK